MTDGTFWVSDEGKVFKRFGSHDADALSLISKVIPVRFITADRRGFPISEARICREMGYDLSLVTGKERFNWIGSNYNFESTVFMGDGYYDSESLAACQMGISPRNGHPRARVAADYVTERSGGDGAVAEACEYISAYYELNIYESHHKWI